MTSATQANKDQAMKFTQTLFGVCGAALCGGLWARLAGVSVLPMSGLCVATTVVDQVAMLAIDCSAVYQADQNRGFKSTTYGALHFTRILVVEGSFLAVAILGIKTLGPAGIVIWGGWACFKMKQPFGEPFEKAYAAWLAKDVVYEGLFTPVLSDHEKRTEEQPGDRPEKSLYNTIVTLAALDELMAWATEQGEKDHLKEDGLTGFEAFKILGCEPSADQTAIKKAYYAKAFQYHPDKWPVSQKSTPEERTAAENAAVMFEKCKKAKGLLLNELGRS